MKPIKVSKMTLQEIKEALDNGQKVFWSNKGYEVIKDVIKRPNKEDVVQYLIHCNINDTYIGLTHKDGVTMNCNSEDEFFIDA